MAKKHKGTSVYVFGHLAWEEEIDSHIKTRVTFGVADEKKTRLAWYMFSQELVVKNWQAAFDLASIGDRTLDRNEIVAGSGWMTGLPDHYDETFAIDKLAEPILTGAGSPAMLDIGNDSVGTTYCIVYIDTFPPHGISLEFELRTESKRRTLDITKSGRVWLLGVEPFSPTAVERGPSRAITFSHIDFYDPVF